MGLFTKDIKTLDDLFVHQLQDIYYAEKQILKALPKMIEKATSPQLKQGLESHRKETETHVARVEQVFEMHGAQGQGGRLPGHRRHHQGSERDRRRRRRQGGAGRRHHRRRAGRRALRDTRYGTLVAWAKQLGRPDCASVLEQNLTEEKAADQKLTTLAESGINREPRRPLPELPTGARAWPARLLCLRRLKSRLRKPPPFEARFWRLSGHFGDREPLNRRSVHSLLKPAGAATCVNT